MRLPDVPGVQHSFVTVNGLSFHVAHSGPATAPPLLLLHGFPQHWYMWRDVIGPLAETRHVLAIDLRGFGFSDAPRDGYSTRQRVRDVLAVMDHFDVGSADLVGHDWGAWLAWRIALDHPERTTSLTALSMIHPWPLQRYLAPNTWRWWITMLFEVPVLSEWLMRHRPSVARWLLTRDSQQRQKWTPDLIEKYTAVMSQRERARAGRLLHTQLILHDIPRLLLGRDRKRRITVPTLLLSGDNDALVPPAVMTVPESCREHITSKTIPGGHYIVDENPEGVSTAIATHLETATTADSRIHDQRDANETKNC